MKPITILVAEDHRLVREAWSLILNKDPRFKVVAECGNSESALLQAKTLHPDVILLDVNLGEKNGIELVPLIRKFSPGSKILGLSLYTFPDVARKMMQAGASGYVTKTSPIEELFHAIIAIKKGEKYLCNEIKDLLCEGQKDSDDPKIRISRLSIREIEVISGIRNGLTSNEIANQLYISKKTVEIHRYNILKKLKLSNASELVDFFNNHQTQF